MSSPRKQVAALRTSISRRAALRTLAGAAGAAALLHRPTRAFAQLSGFRSPFLFYSPRLEPFVDPLPRLPILSGSSFELAASNGVHRFHRDLPRAPTFRYGGEPTLGPILEAQRDVQTELTFQNDLGAHVLAKDIDTTLHGVTEDDRTAPRSVLHLHGGVTPPRSDGHPAASILPGDADVHLYPNRQDAACLWYHDHTMGMTRLNCYAGLASLYFLRDRWDTGLPDNPLGLPAGEYEVPLVLMERIFNDDGSLHIRGTWLVREGAWEGGAVGDTGLVNGVVWPELEVARGLTRFRVLNAGSNTVWTLFFSNDMQFWVIGGDGGLLDAPVATREVRIAPGERMDLLVDFSGLSAGETVMLLNKEPVVFQSAILGDVRMPLFCRFRASRARGFRGPVPSTLRGGAGQPPRLPPLEVPTRVRNLTLAQLIDPTRFPPFIMSLNNLTFDTEDMERPRQGTVERWSFINVTPDPHPVHVHLVNFRVLGRQRLRSAAYQRHDRRPPLGTRWAPPADAFLRGDFVPRRDYEAGMKDTVIVDGHSVTSILIRWPTAQELGFDPQATHMPRHDRGGHRHTPIAGYVWHCHLFDHEDHDMMLPFQLVADETSAANGDEHAHLPAGEATQRARP